MEVGHHGDRIDLGGDQLKRKQEYDPKHLEDINKRDVPLTDYHSDDEYKVTFRAGMQD